MSTLLKNKEKLFLRLTNKTQEPSFLSSFGCMSPVYSSNLFCPSSLSLTCTHTIHKILKADAIFSCDTRGPQLHTASIQKSFIRKPNL